MTQCILCDRYLNGALSEEEAAAYRAHAASCPSCRERIDEWRSLEARLKKWAESMPQREATIEESHALMRLASIRKSHNAQGRPRASRIAAGAFLSATAAAVAVFLYLEPGTTPPRDIAVSIAHPRGEKIMQTVSPGGNIEAPEDSSITADIAADKVGLSPKTKLKVIRAQNNRTRLLLEQGTAACRVSKRKAGEEFIVEAYPLTVKVVGTEFSVTRDVSGKTQVAVLEGTVKVTDRQHRVYTLGAKEGIFATEDGEIGPVRRAAKDSLDMTAALLSLDTADDNRVASAPTPEPSTLISGLSDSAESESDTESESDFENEKTTRPAASRNAEADAVRVARRPPPLRKWQNWVLQGQVSRAAEAVRRYLKTAPNDSDAWSVLADCERKQKNFKAAARAYEKVVDEGSSAQRARAAYRLASVLQSELAEHERAIELFELYKKSSNAAPALLRLADVNIIRSLVALRRCEEAEAAFAHIREQERSVLSSNLDKTLAPCNSKD